MRRIHAITAGLRPEPTQVWFALGGALASIELGRLAIGTNSLRLAILGTAACLLIGLALAFPQAVLPALIVWLAVLGLVRRLVDVGAGTAATDPLLVIGPMVIGLLLLLALQSGAADRLGTLGKSVLALNVIVLAEVLNPLQGGLRVGLAGLVFVLVPTLAFWVGRGLVDDSALSGVLKLTALLALGAATYGLAQTFMGFASWDARWIASSDFAALNVGGTIRPFATFSSPAEYGYYLSVAIVLWLCFARTLPRLVLALPAVALLGTALVYEASRTIIVLLFAAGGIVVAALRGVRPPTALLAGAAAVLILFVGVSHFFAGGSASSQRGASSNLTSHAAQGLARPFSSNSTAPGHIHLVLNGLRSAVTNPAGHGAGSVTIAASKYGGQSRSTEFDPSNAAEALGAPGLIAYLFVLISGLGLVYRNAARRRDVLSVAALGLLVATLFQWLNGGQYAVGLLPWLVLGWADRNSHDEVD